MALKGKLEEVSIGNIFQMIFMEKKAGLLRVRSMDKSAQIHFLGGKILSAKLDNQIELRRLKLTLINNRYLTEDQWKKVLKEADRTMATIWSVLYKYLDKDIHFFLFQREIEFVMFNMLQWEKGEYEYNVEENFQFDRTLIRPLEGEYLLMEGFRIIDEWKRVAQKLPPFETMLSVADELEKMLSFYQFNTSESDNYIISLVHEPILLEDLLSSSQLNYFETAKILVQLISLELIRVAEKAKIKIDVTDDRLLLKGVIIALIMTGLTVGSLYSNYKSDSFWISDYSRGINYIKRMNAKKGLDRISDSLRYYYSLKKKFPEDLTILINQGFLLRDDIVDPWGRTYVLSKNEFFFKIFSKGARQANTEDDIYYVLNKNELKSGLM